MGLCKLPDLAYGFLCCAVIFACSDNAGPPATHVDAPGDILWAVRNFAATGRPGVDSAAVYTFADDGIVRAFDKNSGVLRWTSALSAPAPGFGEDMLATDGKVLVDEYELTALDASTGKPAWTFQPSAGSGTGWFMIASNGSHAYVGAHSGRGYVYSIDIPSGRQEWIASVYPDDSTRIYDPVVSDGTVYVRFSVWHPNGHNRGGAAAVDAATGQVRWSTLFPIGADSTRSTGSWSIAVGAGVVAVSIQDGRVFGLDAVTGQTRWTIPALGSPPITNSTLGSANPDIRALAVSGSTLFVGSSTGFVTAYRLADATQVWQQEAPYGGTWVGMASDATQVYIPHAGGQLTVMDVATGRLRFREDGIGLLIAPRVDGDRLYASGFLGVWAIRAR